MNILAIDSSGSVASVAVGTENKLIAQYYIDDKLTHSQKLMPMIDRVLCDLDMAAADIDIFGAVTGPGSFTGLRIGIATVKGLAAALQRPVIGVSSVMAMAYNFPCSDMPIYPLIDARNNQAYFGCYRFTEGKICEITAPSCEDISTISALITEPSIVMGDGSVRYKEALSENKNIIFAPPHLNMLSGAGAYMAVAELAFAGKTISAGQLLPLYLKKSQAEQERERIENK